MGGRGGLKGASCGQKARLQFWLVVNGGRASSKYRGLTKAILQFSCLVSDLLIALSLPNQTVLVLVLASSLRFRLVAFSYHFLLSYSCLVV